MSSKLKESQQSLRNSFEIDQLTKEINAIVSQIENDHRASHTQENALKPIQESNSASLVQTPNSTSRQNRPDHENEIVNESSEPNALSKLEKSEPRSAGLPEEKRVLSGKSSPFGKKRFFNLADNRQSLIRSSNPQTINELFKQKQSTIDLSSLQSDLMEVTAELDNIYQTITDLQRRESPRAYQTRRQRQLDSLMRTSKLSGIRNTIKLEQVDSDFVGRNDSKQESRKNPEGQFTMKKCSTCDMYFPMDKAEGQCVNCGQ